MNLVSFREQLVIGASQDDKEPRYHKQYPVCNYNYLWMCCFDCCVNQHSFDSYFDVVEKYEEQLVLKGMTFLFFEMFRGIFYWH